MKKIFKTLMLILVLLPCSLIFISCGEQTDSYNKQENIKNFKNAVAYANELCNNFTLDLQLTSGLSQDTNEQESALVLVDLDNKRIQIEAGDTKAVLTETKLYVCEMEDYGYGPWSVTDISKNIFDYLNLKMSDEQVDAFIDRLFSLNSKAINTKTVEDKTIVSVRVDGGEYIKQLLAKFQTYRNKSISNLIDDLLLSLGSETTVESLFTKLKTNLTNESTFMDLITNVIDVTPEQINELLNIKISTLSSYITTDIEELVIGKEDSLTIKQAINLLLANLSSSGDSVLDVDTILNMKLLDMLQVLGFEGADLNTILDNIEQTLNSYTVEQLVNSIINSMISVPGGNGFDVLIQTLNNFNFKDLSLTVNLITEDNALKSFEFLGNCNIVYNASGESEELVNAWFKVVADIKNVGTTVVTVPTTQLVEKIEVSVNASQLVEDNDLVIEEIKASADFEYANAKLVDGTLTISKACVNEILKITSNTSYADYNIFIIKLINPTDNSVIEIKVEIVQPVIEIIGE